MTAHLDRLAFLKSFIISEDKVIAVGRAVLSSEMINDFKKGVAVKVRDSLKSRNEEISS